MQELMKNKHILSCETPSEIQLRMLASAFYGLVGFFFSETAFDFCNINRLRHLSQQER